MVGWRVEGVVVAGGDDRDYCDPLPSSEGALLCTRRRDDYSPPSGMGLLQGFRSGLIQSRFRSSNLAQSGYGSTKS
jgi:hypothetical protein